MIKENRSNSEGERLGEDAPKWRKSERFKRRRS